MTIFNNSDSSVHIEKFLEKFMSNMALSGLDRQINTHQIMETFFRSFLSRLDTNKNFYFIENSSIQAFSVNKTLYDSNNQHTYTEMRYEVDQTARAEFRLSAYDMGNNDKIQHVMEVVGADSGHRLHNECFGDSYVISEPVISLAMDPMGYNDIRFSLRFNICPKIYKRTVMDPKYGGMGVKFPSNYTMQFTPTYP